MSKLRYLVGISSVSLLVCCSSPAPQRPSQRKSRAVEPDSATLAIMELNMQLALAADQQVQQAVMAQEESYALYEGKTWIHIFEQGDTGRDKPIPGETCVVHMRVYTLDNRLLTDTEGTYTIGKSELPQAVDMNIRELHPGAKVRMYAPWYTAFGQQGNISVPPYENVRIDLELK